MTAVVHQNVMVLLCLLASVSSVWLLCGAIALPMTAHRTWKIGSCRLCSVSSFTWVEQVLGLQCRPSSLPLLDLGSPGV